MFKSVSLHFLCFVIHQGLVWINCCKTCFCWSFEIAVKKHSGILPLPWELCSTQASTHLNLALLCRFHIVYTLCCHVDRKVVAGLWSLIVYIMCSSCFIYHLAQCLCSLVQEPVIIGSYHFFRSSGQDNNISHEQITLLSQVVLVSMAKVMRYIQCSLVKLCK